MNKNLHPVVIRCSSKPGASRCKCKISDFNSDRPIRYNFTYIFIEKLTQPNLELRQLKKWGLKFGRHKYKKNEN